MIKIGLLLSLFTPLASLYAETIESEITVIPKEQKSNKKNTKELKKRYKELNNSALKKDMPLSDLQEFFSLCQQLDWKDEALLCIPHLQKKITDPKELKKLQLIEADILFSMGKVTNFKKAAEKYRAFIKNYPGSEEIEYAYYKAITSLNETINIPERDQTATHDILDLIEDYFDNNYTRYAKELTALKEKCVSQLYQKEVTVFDHYLASGKIPAAKQRLACIEQDYGSILSQEQSYTLPMLQCRLAFAENDMELYNTLMAKLEKNYSTETASFRMAQAKLEKKTTINA